jgi:hypothetical protein
MLSQPWQAQVPPIHLALSPPLLPDFLSTRTAEQSCILDKALTVISLSFRDLTPPLSLLNTFSLDSAHTPIHLCAED